MKENFEERRERSQLARRVFEAGRREHRQVKNVCLWRNFTCCIFYRVTSRASRFGKLIAR